jgi:RND superfamily putative drug exporter
VLIVSVSASFGPGAWALTAPTGRRAKWVFLALWVAVLALASPLAGKLSDAQNNEASAWLSSSAESTQVAELADQFPGADTALAAVVFVRADGLTAADRTTLGAKSAELAEFAADRQPSPPQLSDDGQAMIVPVLLPDEFSSDTVNDIRSAARAGLPAGLDVQVAGPAAAAADMADVFDGLDTKLLLVAGAVVAVLLLVIYRSPVLWLLPLLAAAVASQAASAVVYLFARHAGLAVNGQSQGILMVLVFGVATDYALLLIARYREELHRHPDRHRAMAVAVRRAIPAVAASAATVILGMLCLLAAELSSNHDLGPVCAIGVVCALAVMATLLPALLVICGRWVFWPFTPRAGADVPERHGLWTRIAGLVGRRPRVVALGSAAVLVVFGLGLIGASVGLTHQESYTSTPKSVAAQQALAAHFPAGQAEPVEVIASADRAGEVLSALESVAAVAHAQVVAESADGSLARIEATLSGPPDSAAARAAIGELRGVAHAVPGANALVGGQTAVAVDSAAAWDHDDRVVMPLILLMVLAVLMLVLRSLWAPVLLVATVVASYAASLGAANWLFTHAFGFAALDDMVPLLGFLFLVALGVDYNIFLMTRVREEAHVRGHRAGVLGGLTVTGGVITSAGVVLAATFTALGVLPLVAMAEVGVLVALGVLVDTLLVRSLLVPALALIVGARIWWPCGPRARSRGRASLDGPASEHRVVERAAL